MDARSYISTHAPAGGATKPEAATSSPAINFYSRPCGRGDELFGSGKVDTEDISTHAPAGGATQTAMKAQSGGNPFLLTPLREGRLQLAILRICVVQFLLTPLREGRRNGEVRKEAAQCYFYSRPCGRGDGIKRKHVRERGRISTHAPAGGATAIFHKSVMRFCGKLPKDDTVLCLASFGFPRRDPKAVYLAWISCANLPQKCVREGLALKDQGTSCFHEGLASHAFDPVLV